MKYSDTDFVEAVYKRDRAIEFALFDYCKNYFNNHYKAVFFVGDDYKKEIFQESMIKLVSQIERRKIYVEKGVLKGHDGKVFYGKLTTYFMSIAKMKYMEWVRQEKQQSFIDKRSELDGRSKELEQYQSQFYGSDDKIMLDIIGDLINRMPKRCYEILTSYYYKRMSLDDIKNTMPTFESKNALKTAKFKCMETLRNSAKSVYHKYLNS